MSSRVVAVVILAAAACIPRGPSADPLAGDYEASGAGAAVPQMQALTAEFDRRHPGVVWHIANVGSDGSVSLVIAGAVDIGFVSRNLAPREAEQLGVEPLGVTGTAIVVNSANAVRDLSLDQLASVFSGDVTDWSEVGGSAGKIRVLVREPGSAARIAFDESVGRPVFTYAKDALELYKPQATLDAIKEFPNAVGMVTFTSRTIDDPQLRLLTINGVAPAKTNLQNFTYPLRRPLFVIWSPETARRKAAVGALLELIRSDAGQHIANGF